MDEESKATHSDGGLSGTIRESAQQIWLAGLGAFAKAQEGGNKVFETLVREGEAIQSKSRKVAEDTVAEMAGKATGTWDKLEQVFENRVAKALNHLEVPTRDDFEALYTKLEQLTAEVEKLNSASAVPSKPVAKRRAATAASVSAKSAGASKLKKP